MKACELDKLQEKWNKKWEMRRKKAERNKRKFPFVIKAETYKDEALY